MISDLTVVARLFLVVLLYSRLFQFLSLPPRPVSNALINSNQIIRSSCKFDPNAPLPISLSSDIRVLFIVLDAYPTPYLFHKLSATSSRLHHTLLQNSYARGSGLTPIPRTPYSLAYILGGIYPPTQECTFPFVGYSTKIMYINGNNFHLPIKPLCTSNLHDLSLIRRFITSRNPTLKSENQLKNCSVANLNTIFRLVKYISQDNPSSGKVYIFHDLYFHSNTDSSRIATVDNHYAVGIQDLIARLKMTNSVDFLVVLSDHGPRLSSVGGPLKSGVSIAPNSLQEHNYFRYFYYVIPIRGLHSDVLRALSRSFHYASIHADSGIYYTDTAFDRPYKLN
jgi:hypothetical protein